MQRFAKTGDQKSGRPRYGTRRMLWQLLLCGALLALQIAVHPLWASPNQDGSLAFELSSLPIQLQEPSALRLTWLLPVLLFIALRSLADLPWQQLLLSFVLRAGTLLSLSLALARPVLEQASQRVYTVFLVDVSGSVSDEALVEARTWIGAARQHMQPDDRVELVQFAGHPQRLPLKADEPLPPLRSQEAHPTLDLTATNLQAALQLAFGILPNDYVGHIILLSDGVETSGQAIAEAARAQRRNTRISTWRYQSPPPPDVAVVDLSIPENVKVGQPFYVTASIRSNRAASVRAVLRQGEVENPLDSRRELELEPGLQHVRFRSVVRLGGPVSYRVDVRGMAEDRIADNNQYVTSVDVPGRPRILYIEGQPAHARYLQSALTAQQFDVEVRSVAALPRSLNELSNYDLFILSDVPAAQVDAGVQSLIERYVRDEGGGFVFAGGGRSYGPGGWSGTPLEELLPVRMDSERHKNLPGVAMALVIDRSGSMTGLPMEMAKAACAATVETLRGSDLVEIIAFDSSPRRFVKLQPARYRARIQSEIATIQPGGGTAIFPALDAAYQDMSVVQARRKHVILLTDGRGEAVGLRDLVSAMIGERITVTTVGLGDGADADLLRLLAEGGGGRYHHVPDPNSLPRIFTRETEIISRNAAVQDWFPVFQTGPADFLRGVSIGNAPLLHGYVSTQLKSAPAQQVLSSDQGEPILARWRVGLGWVVAWTSDVKNAWASEWLTWPQFGRFWGQLAREHMRSRHRRELAMHTELADGVLTARVDSYTANGDFDNQLESSVDLVGPLPSQQTQKLSMVQVAPGRYEARAHLSQHGSYLLNGNHYLPDARGDLQLVAVSHGQASWPYPREYESLAGDPENLAQIADTGGGSSAPTPAAAFDPQQRTITHLKPTWPPLVLLAMGLMLLDLLLRRVRLFDRDFRAASRALAGAGRG